MLEGKVALVTGGSRGIGKAIACKLAQQGAHIALLYAGNTAAAQETAHSIEAEGVKCLSIKCNVADAQQVDAAIGQITAELGAPYILINNAGITIDKLAVQMDASDFEQVIQTNLTGAFNLISKTYRGFLRQKEGRIINIASVAGIMGNAGQANYSAAKAGLIGLTKSIAKELAPRGVTCNAVAPGLVDTDMTQAMNEPERTALLDAVPLKRMGTAAEIAELVAFLASPQAGYITGTVIAIDGGLSM